LPNSLQYPLERERDLQRRWQQLVQRTTAPNVRAAFALKRSIDNWSERPRDEKYDIYATSLPSMKNKLGGRPRD
jgi:hypothetical protein